MKSSTIYLTAVACAGALLAPALPAFADNLDTTVAAATDNDLQYRVSSALHSDPYLYARHIEVAIKDGDVVLTGLVANDWELSKAVKLATEAAKPHKVIDSIEIQQSGKR